MGWIILVYKLYIQKTFLCTAIVLSIFAAVNYYFDIYGIFRRDFSFESIEPNQHIVKMQYLLEEKNKTKYNAFMFGQSRIGNIDLTKIDNGYQYYNMTYSAGLPLEWLNDIKILLNNGIKIKQIVLGIDDMSFTISPEEHLNDLLRMPYSSSRLYYCKYLFRIPDKGMIKAYYAAKDGRDPHSSLYDIYGSGRPLHEKADNLIESNIEEHINNIKFQKYDVPKASRVEKTLDEISEIKKICYEHDIELIVFINPLHKTAYMSNNLKEFDRLKKGLSNIVDYYDFSGLNSITMNNYNYYETAHYRPLVGALIIKRLFNKDINDIPEDFGILVNKNNVDEHLKQLHEKESQYGITNN